MYLAFLPDILCVMPEVIIDEKSYENFIGRESIIGECPFPRDTLNSLRLKAQNAV